MSRSGAGLAVEVMHGTICYLLVINSLHKFLIRPPCVGPISHEISNYSWKKVLCPTSLVVLKHQGIALRGRVLRLNHLADREEAMDAQEKRDEIEEECGEQHPWFG